MQYKKAITNYGIAQPLLFCLILIGLAGGAAYYVKSELKDKQSIFNNYQRDKNKAIRLEGNTAENLKDLDRWEDIMSSNAESTMEEQFNIAAARARSPQLERTRKAPASRPGAAALAMENQKSQTYDLVFRGAYRDVQKMFIDFEYRLPNLFLERISITPDRGTRTSATYNLSYTIWRQ